MEIENQDNLIDESDSGIAEAALELGTESATQGAEAPPPKKDNAKLKTRVMTGAVVASVYAMVIILTLWISDFFELSRLIFDGFVILVAFLASMEMCDALSKKFSSPMRVFVLINLCVGFTMFYITHYVISPRATDIHSGGITAFFFVLAATFLSCIIFNIFYKKYTMNNVLTTMLVLVYPAMLCVYMLSLNYLRPIGAPHDTGLANAAVLLMFLIPAFSDTGAWLIGSIFKGPKLAPSISPKKTISGAIGGILGGILAGGIALIFSRNGILGVGLLMQDPAFNVVNFLMLGLFGAVFVVIGDLVASYIKRQCGVKDFGNLLPEHGGVMDRVDSMMMCAAFLYIYFYIMSFFAA